ncbi:xanthine dehydrogenase family protein molybdopterin-binding subunit [bacterium]|nr:xanthine dehydrogenase family protein molybdopterin-binding subunit [bacterium]
MSEVKLKLGIPGKYEERVVTLPEGEPKPYDADSKLSVVGSRHPRLDGFAKVTGQAKYAHDIRLPDMLYAALLSCPHPHARVKSLDTSAAENMPGVKAVVAAADQHVRFAGQYVAAVAAETLEQAERACRAIKVDYEPLPFVVDLEEARQPGAPKVFDNRDSNVRAADPTERGNLAEGFAAADAVVEATYKTQVQTHACMETHGLVAHWEAPDKLKVWSSTQGTFAARDNLARRFELGAENVEVITEYMGGGFGSKLGLRDFESAAVELARKAGRPVHLMVDRKFEHLSTGNRPNSVQVMKAGCTKDGKVTAWQVDSYGTSGIGGGAGVANPSVYDFPAVRKTSADVYTNAGPGCPMRAPGHPQGIFAVESMMDELAYKIGMDPVEFRRKNNSHPIRDAEFELGMKAIGWERRNQTPGAGPGPLHRGIGVASGRWSNVGERRNSRIQVRVAIHPDGGVEVENGAQDLGTGTRTIVGLLAAEELGLPVEALTVKIGHTSYPYGPASGGSSTAPGLAPTVRKAALLARRRLFEVVAPALQAQPEQLECRDGKITVVSDPGKTMDWKRACGLLGTTPINELATRSDNFDGWQAEAAGVQFAEVEVDVETGRVRVLKVVVVQDCGTVLDRLTAESQVIGAVIQGISYALLEDRILDRTTGVMVNPNLEQYKIAGSWDMPEIEAIMYDAAIGYNNAGVNGLGEPPVTPTAAAIANAVYNAAGLRMRELPITPWRVLAADAARRGGRS